MMAWWMVSIAWGHGGVTRTVQVDEGTLTVAARADAVLSALGVTAADLPHHRSAVSLWLVDGLEVTAGDQVCGVGPPVLTVGPETLVATRSLSCAHGPRTLSDSTLAGTEQTLVVAEHTPLVLDRTNPSVVLPASLDLLTVVRNFSTLGALHLVTGYDHVLFLLCLLFVSGPIARRDGWRTAAGQLAQTVTAFTIGHSVTLAAAALDLVLLPSRWVEATIALSIAVAAAMNVVQPNANTRHRPWLALGFGLVHGFGFSSVLAEVGLPIGSRVAALFSFNMGIELAQLAVVAVAVAPLARLASRPEVYRRWVMQAASLAIGSIALYWTGVRLWST